ncbi:immunoglobulin-like domain-containing protein [Bacteroidota bacterium]
MKSKLFSILLVLFALNFSYAQNVDSFMVSNDTVRSCTDRVTLVNHSTNYDSLAWIVTGSGGVIPNLPHDTIIKFYLMDIGCYDIKLLIWRNGTYDSTIQFCAVYCLPPKLVYLQGKEIDTIEVFMSYIDSGYNAVSNCSGIKSQGILGSVDPDVVGKYVLKYYAVDNAGFSDTAIRIVYVVDRIAPFITLLGPDTMYLDKGCHFNDYGVTIYDNYYCFVLPTSANNIDTSNAGSYEIMYWAIDSSGNYSDTVRRVVIIQDINLPELAADTAYVEVYHAYKPNIIFNHKCCTLAESDIYMSGNVDTSHLGIYTSQIWIQDCVGNISDTISQIVIVGDTTPPVIIWNESIFIRFDEHYKWDSLKFKPMDLVQVTDNYDTNLKVAMSGTYFTDFIKSPSIGLYSIVLSAQDLSGNHADSLFIIIQILYISVPEFNQKTFRIFPNPNNGSFIIENTEFSSPIESLRITNGQGQVVYVSEGTLEDRVEIGLNQPAGLYFVFLQTAKGVLVKKVVVE